jgi:hypothetical protein
METASMSEESVHRPFRARPFWAILPIALAMIGAASAADSTPAMPAWLFQALAGPNILPTCSSDYTEWNPNGGQYASHKAQSQLDVTLSCDARPQANTDCAYCLSYETDTKLLGVWFLYDGPHQGTVVVTCGNWDREIWTTTFTAIPIGQYRVNASLWIGGCDNPTKTLVEHSFEPYNVTY